VSVGALDGRVYAVDRETGRETWHAAVGPVYGSLARTGTRVVATTFSTADRGGLFGVEDGAVQWRFQPGAVGSRSSPAVAGTTAYVGHQDGRVYAVDVTDGSTVWSYDTGAAAVDSSPAVVENALYVGDDSGTVHALVGT
jgi:outer membrane protein assembly factor BamB